jgi:hypothetical protein
VVYDTEVGGKEYVVNDFSPRHFIIPQADVGKCGVDNNFVRLGVPDIGNLGLADLKEVANRNPGTLEIVVAPQEQSEHLVEDAKAIPYREDEMLERYVDQVGCGLEMST